MPEELLPRRRVMAVTSMSGPTLWRRCKDGSFPLPIKIGPNRVAWRQSDVQRWIDGLRRTDGTLAAETPCTA
jgi:prophage regulatory protein